MEQLGDTADFPRCCLCLLTAPSDLHILAGTAKWGVMHKSVVRNHSSHSIISNPFWVPFPGGKKNQRDGKRNVFQIQKQCLSLTRFCSKEALKQSHPPDTGMQPAGISVGYTENQWIPCGRLSTLETRKIERKNALRVITSTFRGFLFLPRWHKLS